MWYIQYHGFGPAPGDSAQCLVLAHCVPSLSGWCAFSGCRSEPSIISRCPAPKPGQVSAGSRGHAALDGYGASTIQCGASTVCRAKCTVNTTRFRLNAPTARVNQPSTHGAARLTVHPPRCGAADACVVTQNRSVRSIRPIYTEFRQVSPAVIHPTYISPGGSHAGTRPKQRRQPTPRPQPSTCTAMDVPSIQIRGVPLP
jgi:hypothetical protein